jgi:uncharacterized protein (UPF0335 family)
MAKTNFARDQLRSVIERIENLEKEKAELASDIKEVFAEARGNGFDVKIIRKVLRIRKQDAAERSTEEEMIDLYLSAVGFEKTPLGQASGLSLPETVERLERAAALEDAA